MDKNMNNNDAQVIDVSKLDLRYYIQYSSSLCV